MFNHHNKNQVNGKVVNRASHENEKIETLIKRFFALRNPHHCGAKSMQDYAARCKERIEQNKAFYADFLQLAVIGQKNAEREFCYKYTKDYTLKRTATCNDQESYLKAQAIFEFGLMHLMKKRVFYALFILQRVLENDCSPIFFTEHEKAQLNLLPAAYICSANDNKIAEIESIASKEHQLVTREIIARVCYFFKQQENFVSAKKAALTLLLLKTKTSVFKHVPKWVLVQKIITEIAENDAKMSAPKMGDGEKAYVSKPRETTKKKCHLF